MIAFKTWEGDQLAPSLRIVDRQTGAVREIEGVAGRRDVTLLDWSPDGACMALTETVGGTEFWRSSALLDEG